MFGPGAAAPAFAATPPAAPDNITIFPDRDFVSLNGYAAQAGQTATITVTRAGVVSGRAQGTIVDADPALEVNHPGGVPWGTGPGAPPVTPNIKAGDVVTVSFPDGTSDSAVTQAPAVTGFTHTAGSTQLVVNGNLGALGAPVANAAQTEQRIVEPALRNTAVGRRDLRAGDTVPDVFSSTIVFTATTFTATYDFADPKVADVAAGGQMRMMGWMSVDAAANRQGLTISEFGETGGAGVGGGPPGPGSTAPNAPTNVSGIRGNSSITASWEPATTIIDGAAVTGYVLEIEPVGGGLISRTTIVGADLVSQAVGGLTNGTPYTISVRATSAAGQGPVGMGGPVTPSADVATAPGPTTAVTATAGNASAMVAWTPPVDNGGSPITSSSVRVVNASNVQLGVLRLAAGGANNLRVTGLANGTAVRFQVQSTSALGTGAFSALSAATTPATVPGAPGLGTATRGNASMLVRWTTPVNGGAAISGYTVRVVNAITNRPVGVLRTAGANATSLNVTGLVNGMVVRFQVQARNRVGAGAYSGTSAGVTPAGTAGKPTIGLASSGVAGGTINATGRWTAPISNGGSVINGYVVSALRIDAAGRVASTVSRTVSAGGARSLTMTLPSGNYRFIARARNAVGLGANSASSNMVAAR